MSTITTTKACPICGYPMVAVAASDLSARCFACGRWWPLPERQLTAPPLTERRWREMQEAAR